MKTYSLICAAAVLFQAVAEGKDVIVESLPKVPMGWRKLRNAEPDQVIKLRIALVQPGLGQFEQTLYDISTPQHPLYGRHLSRDEVREMMKPKEESTSAVLKWLQDAGIPSSNVENDGEWIKFQTTVLKAASLLGTDFQVYNHVGTDAQRVRTLQYVLIDLFATSWRCDSLTLKQLFRAGGDQTPYHHDTAHNQIWPDETTGR